MQAQQLQKDRKFHPKLFSWILIALNALSFVFLLIYEIVHHESAVSNAFGTIVLFTLLFDLFYAAGTRNPYGFGLIWLFVFGMIVIFGANYVAGLVNIHSSVSVIANIVILLLPLIGAALLLCDLFDLRPKAIGKRLRRLEIASSVLITVFLILIVILSHDAINNYGYTWTEFPSTYAEFLLWFSIIAILMLTVRTFVTDSGLSPKASVEKNWAYLLVIFVLGGYGLVNFLSAQSAVQKDITAAHEEFTQAFGSQACLTQEGMRNVPYSLPDLWTGIRTDRYDLTKDIVYYNDPNGLTLRYDVYAPQTEDAHRSALVMVHGRGCDKGNMSVPHRNKYFASQGYVVFDLQIGDYGEHDTNASSMPDDSFTQWAMLENIDRFFRYAVRNDPNRANWSSVFLSGYSMGGGMVLSYSNGYDNVTASLGITLKGIVPCYPGTDIRSVGQIGSNSVPCLMLMGTHDGLVERRIVTDVKNAYQAVDRTDCAGIWITATGHGNDTYMTGRANQIFLYYMERFLAYYR